MPTASIVIDNYNYEPFRRRRDRKRTRPDPPRHRDHRGGRRLRVLPMPEQEFRLCADSYLAALAPLYGSLVRLEEPQAGYRLHGSGGFAGVKLRDRITRGLALIEQLFAVTAEHAQALGREPNRAAWLDRSWWHRVARAYDDVAALMDPSADFILIDDDRLGLTWSCELRRMRDAGARYAVILWSSFWWLDQYPELAAELAAGGPPLLDDDRVKVFDLVAAEPVR